MLERIAEVGDVGIVRVTSEVLDASNVKQFKQEIQPFTARHSKMVLDLSAVTFLDSAGLGALLSCLRQVSSQGGDLKICSATKPVRALLQLVRMHKIVDILNTHEEAVRAFEV